LPRRAALGYAGCGINGRGSARILESWKDNRRAFAVLAAPGSFWLLVFFVIPLGFLFVMSFSDKAIVDGEVSITEYDYLAGFAQYVRSVDPLYLTIMWKSVWISALATALCLAAAYPIAFGICFAPPKWKPILLMLTILPFWINLLIRTYALIAVFRTQGYVNLVLGAAGAGPFDMLYNNGAVIFGLVYVYMPFMVLPLYATIERLDRSFLEASLDLGASQFKTFMKVTVPLTMPGIVTGVILVFIPCLGSFLTPDLLGGANAVMIGNVIERQFKAANDWPFGAALSFLLMYATFGALALRALVANRSKGVGV
jgi:spermidine/putrescine transport system permease protein